MRSDMAKVIVERPRRGSLAYRKRGRTRQLEDEDGVPLPFRVPAGYEKEKTKRLNENLSPLRRYLQSQVGRSWNAVYADISQHLRPTSTVQQHVRDHVGDFVAVHARLESGRVMVYRPYPGGIVPLADTNVGLYVDPRTGLLQRNPFAPGRRNRGSKAKQERAPRMRELAEDLQLHLLKDGAWWEVRLTEIGANREWVVDADHRGGGFYRIHPYVDVVLRPGLSDLPPGELYGRYGVYASAKRQLSRVETKKRALR